MSGSQTATCCHSFETSVIIKFAVVMAQERRPVPFRTRKLRPDTARVLHSIGCGRLARCRINLLAGSINSPLFYYLKPGIARGCFLLVLPPKSVCLLFTCSAIVPKIRRVVIQSHYITARRQVIARADICMLNTVVNAYK